MKEHKRNRTYTWFVEPIGAEGNIVIARELSEEDAIECNCNDNKRHLMWRCDQAFVRRVQKSQRSFGITVNVWVQEGHGAIRPFVTNRRHPKKPKIEQQDLRLF